MSHRPLRSVQRLAYAAKGYLFVVPAFLLIVGLIGYPILSAIWLSMQQKALGGESHYVGIRNYIQLFSDPDFRVVVRNSLVYTIGAVFGIKVPFGLTIALLLNQDFRMRQIYRSLFLVPWIIPTAISSLVWRWMYYDIGGILNYALRWLGIIRYDLGWLGDPATAMFSTIVVNGWRGTPFFALSILAVLQTLPNEHYEVAAIEGASAIQQFRHVILPWIRNILLIVTLLSTIWTLADFQIVWVLTRGGPGIATHIFATFAYQTGFQGLEIGRAVAVSLAAFPPMVLLIVATTALLLREE